MICADVQTLARAAPEPVATPKVSFGDAGNSFDQFLQAVTSDHPTGSDTSKNTRTPEREDVKDDQRSEPNKPVDYKPADQKTVNEKKVKEKPVEEKKTEEIPTDQKNAEAEAVDESVQEALAAALAVQAAAAAAPVQQTDAVKKQGETIETTVPPAAIPVMQNQQSTVIQLPETEPQPLPDELKQAVQQPKAEVKDFQTLVDAASQNLENQAVPAETKTVATAATNPVAGSSDLKPLSSQEPAVKVVDLTVQSEDMASIDLNRTTASVYALASAKTDNLVQPKALPIIQKVSTEVIELMREQGQSMRIQIHPENLGKIDLRLVSNSDGMRVIMTAEVPATAKLLESHMDQLQRSLADAGVSISGMSVNSQGAQGQSPNSSLNQSQQVLGRTTLPIIQQDAELVVPAAVQVSTSGLDYRI